MMRLTGFSRQSDTDLHTQTLVREEPSTLQTNLEVFLWRSSKIPRILYDKFWCSFIILVQKLLSCNSHTRLFGNFIISRFTVVICYITYSRNLNYTIINFCTILLCIIHYTKRIKFIYISCIGVHNKFTQLHFCNPLKGKFRLRLQGTGLEPYQTGPIGFCSQTLYTRPFWNQFGSKTGPAALQVQF